MNNIKNEEKIKYKKCSLCNYKIHFVKKNEIPKICPKCKSPHFFRPKIEAQLFSCQDYFIKSNRNPKSLEKMFPILFDYCRLLIMKEIKGKLKLDSEKLFEKTQDAATKIIEYYLSKPEFKMIDSFGGYIQWTVRDVLYNHKVMREEEHDSLNGLISKNKSEIQDNMKSFGYKTITNLELEYDIEENIVNKDLGIVDEIENLIYQSSLKIKQNYSTRYSILFLNAIYFKIMKKSDLFLSEFYNYSGNQIKVFVDSILCIILDYLKHNCKN